MCISNCCQFPMLLRRCKTKTNPNIFSTELGWWRFHPNYWLVWTLFFKLFFFFSFNTSYLSNRNIQKYSNLGQENIALSLRLLLCVLTSITSWNSEFHSLFCSLMKRQHSASNIRVVSYTVCLLLYYKTKKMKAHKQHSLFYFYVCKPFARSWPSISREYLLKSDLNNTVLPIYKQLKKQNLERRKVKEGKWDINYTFPKRQ